MVSPMDGSRMRLTDCTPPGRSRMNLPFRVEMRPDYFRFTHGQLDQWGQWGARKLGDRKVCTTESSNAGIVAP